MQHDPQQQTGRTTRMLLRAILAASEGKKVLVVGRDQEHAAWLCDNARRLAGHIARYRPRSLHIGETGLVQFRAPAPTIGSVLQAEDDGYLLMYDHDEEPQPSRRTLDDIVAAVRSGQALPYDELRLAVVAFDVLLHQLDLPRDPVRLQAYFVAAESVPAEYIGEANDPDNAEAVAWYKAMHNAGARSPDVRQGHAVRDALSHDWDDSGERCKRCGDKDWFAGPACEG